MKHLLVILSLVALTIVGCASKETKTAPEPRKFTKVYKVIDAKSGLIPEWIEDPQEKNGEKSSEQNKYKYFVSESDKVKNKRLCLKSAAARASAEIAAQIAQVIKNDYTESLQSEVSEEAEQYMNESLANEAMAFVAGISTVRTYWEQRKYMTELGAEEDTILYTCHALIKIPREILTKAVNASVKKFLDNGIKDTESKKQAKEALKDVADKMDKMMGSN